jgi:predicted nucleotidyltransferase
MTASEIFDIESGQVSPTVEALRDLLRLLGDDLILGAEKWETGIDLTLNLGNLELNPGQRVERGLAFADFVRRNRGGGAGGLGLSLQPGPFLQTLDRHQVDFVLIGSIAGLVHGSAYPTYDLDLAYADDPGNLNALAAALTEIGLHIPVEALIGRPVLSLDSEFGSLDLVAEVRGIRSYEELQRDADWALIADVSVKVASLDHLIAMKRAAGRRKDQLMVMEYVELRRREEEET